MSEMTTTPSANGEAPLPRRASKGLLPSTWISRELKIEYVDAAGRAATTSAVLLDWFPLGPCLNVAGAKTLVAWERVTLIELQEDQGN